MNIYSHRDTGQLPAKSKRAKENPDKVYQE